MGKLQTKSNLQTKSAQKVCKIKRKSEMSNAYEFNYLKLNTVIATSS